MDNLNRLLTPKSIAVIGGGTWCENVIHSAQKFGFQGSIWPVHPTRALVRGYPAFASVKALPDAPDAAFIGVNRVATLEVLRDLNARGAGGAVCFASGFREAVAELADGADLQADLLANAGEMAVFGPNCYGFVNALDKTALWPDEHGLKAVESGVAILMQSSNIALNLTMQKRGLPIAFLGTVGNQAQTDLAKLGQALLRDPRITALGLHIEGIPDLAAFETLARQAHDLGKRIVALRIGASQQAAAASVSHTASLAGSAAGAEAFLRRVGVAQVRSLEAFLETLKILHVVGPLASPRIASMSCSGGEASLMADSALGTDVSFPALTPAQESGLRAALGPKVALSNPLDYHTYIWGNLQAQTACFTAMMADDQLGLGCVILDYPRGDRCDDGAWRPVIDAMDQAARCSGKPMAILSSLSDTMPEDVADDAIARGLVPLCGIPAALDAIAAAAWLGRVTPAVNGIWQAAPNEADPITLTEDQAKSQLVAFGVPVPKRHAAASASDVAKVANQMQAPFVVKASGLAHKTEAGGVALNLATSDAAQQAAAQMAANGYLVEEMIQNGIAELLVGVRRDAAYGFVLTLGAGGTLTELLRDSVSLVLPVTPGDITEALGQLQITPVLNGFRGAPGVDVPAIVNVVMAVQAYVRHHLDHIEEVEINPLICAPDRAIAVDALIVGHFE